jgi:MFS superfamily sulfate permease-like transporter
MVPFSRVSAMLQAAVAVLFIFLLYTCLALFADRLPPEYQAGVSWLLPLVAFAAIGWAFVPQRRKRKG